MIITPTRELAYQIFETIRKVGKNHDFSAGLVIGGKDWNFESKRLSTCNIIVCTPGRLLQHMDENPQFDASVLSLLVLDEADRCLDMGFSVTMNAILENLPQRAESNGKDGRQTLLFSATQTRSVKDLARLSLENPIYVSVHEKSSVPTPENLKSQCYIVCELSEKINILWSFLKSHKRKKILVFMQSCKQVKYVHEIFRRLRHGAAISALYGTLHQLKRMAIYDEFCKKDQAVLVATDIAARGLDFPSVDWVIQLDCPEDATTYLHRVGRTARHAAVGNSLLILLPSEQNAMLQQLRAHKVPIEKIEPNPKKVINVQRKIEAYLAQDHELKESACRAYVSYLKSTFLLKNKAVFDVFALDTNSFASSLGLAVPPRARFLERQIKIKEQKCNRNKDCEKGDPSEKEISTNGVENSDLPEASGTIKVESSSKNTLGSMLADSSEDEDDDILTVKRQNHDILENDNIPDDNIANNNMTDNNIANDVDVKKEKDRAVVTKAALAKKVLKKGIKANLVTKFDEEGDAIESVYSQKISQEGKEYDENFDTTNETQSSGINLTEAARVLKAEDRYDQQIEREKIRTRKKEEKRKVKEAKRKKMEQSEDEQSAEEDDDEISENDTSDNPDLDWLPDPDEVYGNQVENQSDMEETVKDKTNGIESKGEKRKWKPPKSKSSKIELSDALGIHQQKGSKATSKLSHKKAKYDKNIGDDNTDMGLLNNDEELALQLLSR